MPQAGNVLDLIGHTPLVQIKRLNNNPQVSLLAKLEGFNPGGSIKDRVALAMVEAAERSGELSKGKTIIEATSGNTGIGLAMVCAVKGHKLMLIMPESASAERKRIMTAYGAEIYLTPGHLGTDSAIEEAYRLAREEPDKYVLMDQFNNPASIQAHYQGTAREIWEQTQGEITHAVVALGTSGTAMGLAKYLKEKHKDIQIVAVEPYAGHKIQGLKNMQASYPPGIYNKHHLDRILHVEDEQAFSLCRELAAKEAIFAGMSSGAAFGGALQLASELQQGMIVVIFPDGGERYLSTSLFIPVSKQGLELYSVQKRDKEVLNTTEQPVVVFSPGPSPENPYDLEGWRRLVFMDVLIRYLVSKEVDATGVIGLSDLEDRALARARMQGQSLDAFSREFVQTVQSIANALGLGEGITYNPASREKEAMLKTCQKLLEKGRAYEKLRSVYYDVFRDTEYGQLVQANLDKLSLGKTVDLEDYAKENPRDFTLLKRATLQDIKSGDFFQTTWGNVRPSWYLQMAGTAASNLKHLQVVMAGRHHQFPHLENLRAIWGKGEQHEPHIWTVIQAVSSKSDESSSPRLDELLPDLASPKVLRFWLLSISYRKPLYYSRQNLNMWQNNWKRMQNLAAALSHLAAPRGEVGKDVEQAAFDLKSGFTQAIEDDLGLYRFWPVLFEFGKVLNTRLSRGELSPKEAQIALEQMKKLDNILGVLDWEKMPLSENKWPQEIKELVQARDRAKKAKQFQEADQIRQRIEAEGFILQDTPQGARLYAKKATDKR